MGAEVQEDISEASLVIGVKQVPIDHLLPNKTYAFFSQIAKGQLSNISLLNAVLKKNIRLIDYRRMVDSEGTPVLGFGKYAGAAGMINILHVIGLRLLALGHYTPFLHIAPCHSYSNFEVARQAVRVAGSKISLGQMPNPIGPITFIFTGTGAVLQGAQEILQELPLEYSHPQCLPTFLENGALNKLHACVLQKQDLYKHKNGGNFDNKEFLSHPERYAGTFSKIAPYASCVVNGLPWTPSSSRLISIRDAKALLQPRTLLPPGSSRLPHRLLAICDLSDDPEGSIEFAKECTAVDSPFCLYDPEEDTYKHSFRERGVMLCSIDMMSAQIARNATDCFGSLLLPYIRDMFRSSAMTPFEDYDAGPIVKNAVITSNGKLTFNFKYT
ncbi:alpha-aminoadipic semialdehyde synthase, mitochondrial-like isoform X2 [Littorina saxatilis]